MLKNESFSKRKKTEFGDIEVKAKGLKENYSKEWDKKKKLSHFSLVHEVIPV